MKCPKCHHYGCKVLESRGNGSTIRRRRECENCGHRFTTFEKVESKPLLVIKKNGNREEFSRDKLTRGIVRSSEKRPVTMEQINKIIDDILKKAAEENDDTDEITSEQIGEGVMNALKKIDEISYIRFASVYRQFKEVSDFKKLINDEGK